MNNGLLLSYQKGLNFWELHTYWRNIKEIDRFYQKDRSQEDGKTTRHKSSRIMWALLLMYDMGVDNFYRHLPEKRRRIVLAEEIIQEPKFNWSEYEDIEKIIKERATTPAQRHYITLMKKLNERDEFINNTPYSLDQYVEINGKNVLVKGTADQLEKMLSSSDKIYQTLETINKKLELQKVAKKNEKLKSATEEGLI